MEFLFKLTRTLSAPHTGWWWSEQGKSQVAPFFELFWKSLELLAFLCFPLASPPSSSLQSTFRFLRLTLRILERSLSFGTESLLLSSCTWSTKNIFVSPSLGVETQNWLDPRPSRRTVRPWIVEWGERIPEMWFIRKWCKISARELFPSVRDAFPFQNRWIFGKVPNSLCPPPSFSENHFTDFATKLQQKGVCLLW